MRRPAMPGLGTKSAPFSQTEADELVRAAAGAAPRDQRSVAHHQTIDTQQRLEDTLAVLDDRLYRIENADDVSPEEQKRVRAGLRRRITTLRKNLSAPPPLVSRVGHGFFYRNPFRTAFTTGAAIQYYVTVPERAGGTFP